jgi:hypothetical protein
MTDEMKTDYEIDYQTHFHYEMKKKVKTHQRGHKCFIINGICNSQIPCQDCKPWDEYKKRYANG